MATSDEKLDRVLEHILDVKEAIARLEGAELPRRVKELEEADKRTAVQLAKVGVLSGAGVALLVAGLKKLGIPL